MTLSPRTALVGLLLCAVIPACGPGSVAPAKVAAMPEYPPPLEVHRNAPRAVAAAPAAVRHRSIDGVVIKLIHTARRAGDARAAAVRLRGLGARVELAETSDTGNEPHTGKAYFYEGYSDHAAAIASAIADIEEVVPAATDGANPDLGQQINLWIVHVSP